MKAILEFTLPEETNEHQTALEGGKWRAALEELDNWLRGIDKYGGEVPTAQGVRTKIYEILQEDNLSLYK